MNYCRKRLFNSLRTTTRASSNSDINVFKANSIEHPYSHLSFEIVPESSFTS